MRVPETLAEELLNFLGNQFHFKGVREASNFKMTEEDACQTVLDKWRDGLISLHIWDGRKECSLQDWLHDGNTVSQFFLNTTDCGYVRVRRSAGLLSL